MKISETIQMLKELQIAHGDLPIILDDDLELDDLEYNEDGDPAIIANFA